jgi:multicomponent Na+:H+ antiporter subunit G
MELYLNILSSALMAIGCFFILIGSFGLIRLPDFFTRLHAASLIDTMGAYGIILGVAIRAGWDLSLFKLASILVLLAITGPTATHALARSALSTKVLPKDENGEDITSIL